MDPITVLLIIFLLYPVPALTAYRMFQYCHNWDPEEFEDPILDIPKLIKVSCTVPVWNLYILFEVFKHYIDIRRRKWAAAKILKGILSKQKEPDPDLEREFRKIIKELKK